VHLETASTSIARGLSPFIVTTRQQRDVDLLQSCSDRDSSQREREKEGEGERERERETASSLLVGPDCSEARCATSERGREGIVRSLIDRDPESPQPRGTRGRRTYPRGGGWGKGGESFPSPAWRGPCREFASGANFQSSASNRPWNMSINNYLRRQVVMRMLIRRRYVRRVARRMVVGVRSGMVLMLGLRREQLGRGGRRPRPVVRPVAFIGAIHLQGRISSTQPEESHPAGSTRDDGGPDTVGMITRTTR